MTQLSIAKALEKRRRTKVERSKISHDLIAYQASIRKNAALAAAHAERQRIAGHVRKDLFLANPEFARARMEFLNDFLGSK